MDDFLETGYEHTESILKFIPVPILQDLISPEERTCINDFARAFNSELTSFFGFEVPLSSKGSGADILLCMHQPDELLKWIEASAHLRGIASPVFEGLVQMVKEWGNSAVPINNIWFEYDYELLAERNYLPNLFIAPGRGNHPWEVISMLDEMFNHLAYPMEKEVFTTLLRCYTSLPNGSWISQVGCMVARKELGMRVFVQDMPKGSIPNFLRDMGLTSRLDGNIISWLSLANELASKVDLDLDLNPKLGKKLGIEVYFNEMEEALLFLKFLKAKKLCTPAKYESLWQRLIAMNIDRTQPWNHFLSHFKLSFAMNGMPVAKAYLGYIHTPQLFNINGTKPFKVT